MRKRNKESIEDKVDVFVDELHLADESHHDTIGVGSSELRADLLKLLAKHYIKEFVHAPDSITARYLVDCLKTMRYAFLGHSMIIDYKQTFKK